MAGSQRSEGLNKSCILLIVLAGIERFISKGLAANLVTYLTDVMKMSNSAAAKTVNNWCGFSFILPLLSASLADRYWNRYCTILASAFLYVAGLLALTSTAWFPINNMSSSFLLVSLFVISLSQSGYNPSLQAFAADQLRNDDELPDTNEEQKTDNKSLFFNWWYFGVCSGALLGITLLCYIQDAFGWVLGFAVPTILMAASISLLLCGNRMCKFKACGDVDFNELVTKTVRCITKVTGMFNDKITLPNDQSEVAELELQEKPLFPQKLDSSTVKKLNEKPESGEYLPEKLKIVIRLLPMWTLLLMFAVIFQQPYTFFTKQGMEMKRNIGKNFKIPPATLQSVITASIILVMPFYSSVLIPIARRITGNEKGITIMQRMGIGIFLSAIAMAIAALVETKRLEIRKAMQVVGSQSETAPLSIYWLLPQYILLGISDVFTVVGLQEFFYSEVSVEMKATGLALYSSVLGVGSFMSALLISVIEAFTSLMKENSWFVDDMKEARLDKFYWLLAMLSSLNLLLYVILCKFYTSRSEILDNERCK